MNLLNIFRFVSLNAYISNLSESDEQDTEEKQKNHWTLKKKDNRVMDINIIGKSVMRIKHVNVIPFNNNTINILCEMHDTLCNLSKLVNSVYSLHILLNTSTTFVVLVTQLYFFYLMLSANQNYILTYDKVWTAASWGIIFFVLLFTISLACSKTKEEVRIDCYIKPDCLLTMIELQADVSSTLLHKMPIDDDDDFTRTSVRIYSKFS